MSHARCEDRAQHLLAVFALNALLVGLTVGIVFRHTTSVAVGAVALPGEPRGGS